ncbi:hypothetical protein BGW36DRAFT_460013 [Talaromyces proteolyticus]|uniref:Uncharacterized protein n=1 Tax=Talaromyces proteolyticus TaxID=1131652 RepID=A0AAD4KU55_9EURO|nr:uncharacterized protein BGW36DRAFT_460013 [Talaromyces proteolyticus]KAH8700932.1 hypothetical protein BGW36DRAFT_460013 [Talaromyces proteolyticus]
MTTIIRSRLGLTASFVTLAALGGVFAYLGKQRFDHSCPRISITEVPKSSACRKLVEQTGEQITSHTTSWGIQHSTLLKPWPPGNDEDKTRWIPSFAALRAEIPVSLLAEYGRCRHECENKKHDAEYLMRNLVAAFLDARAAGLEARLMDRGVPPLSFAPASLLFGDKSGPGAFMLGTWSTTLGKSLELPDLPSGAPEPSSEFPSNKDVVEASSIDTAGAVIYWRFPDSLFNAVDRAASFGMPWRLMEGGFQEFIVEKISDEMAVVTYVMVECSNLYPRGQSVKDFKMMPKLFYEAHVLYAQSLLYNTVKQLHKSPVQIK